MFYDYSKLKGRIIEKFGSQARFAEAMELSTTSLSLKMTGQIPFKQTEIARACDLLGVEPTQIGVYFFALKVK